MATRYERTKMTCGKAGELRKYHPAYRTWQNMLQRCNNPKIVEYHRYGGRGIKVCDRWNVSANFLDDMLPTWFEGGSIDRVNNDEGYSPENCVWIPRADNIRKTSRSHYVDFRGELLTVRQVSALVCGVSYKTILRRVIAGVPIEMAIRPTNYLIKERDCVFDR